MLGLIISKKLIQIYPKEKEGIIDKKFANLVNKKTCTEIANDLNIKKFMFLGPSHKSNLKSANKIIGDCLEALNWCYLFRWRIKIAETFVLTSWKKYVENSLLPIIDAKTTQLQEHSLKKFKELPKYTFYKKIGPQHKPIFKIDVQIKIRKRY